MSDRGARLATVADFASSRSSTMLKNSVEGPFYFCTNPASADIAQGKAGTPLVVALPAIDAATCRSIANAFIDIWHCDAGGRYSGHDLAVDRAPLPEEENAAVLTHAPYRMPRKGPRIAIAAEDWGLPTMKIVQRRQTRLAVLNLALSV